MLEIPESNTMASQLNETIKGKKIQKVLANATPHRFAFYFGNRTYIRIYCLAKKLIMPEPSEVRLK